MKHTGRKSGAQGPKAEFANSELVEHAREIRRLARSSFADLIKIGEKLIRCRAILKKERTWMTWLRDEFGWSRRQADRYLAMARNREKCATLRTLGLPITAVVELADAPAEVVQEVERRAKTAPLSVREVRLIRQPALPASQPEPISLTAIKTTALPDVTLRMSDILRWQPPKLDGEEEFQARQLVQRLELFAASIRGRSAADDAAVIPAEQRSAILEHARVITNYVTALARGLSADPSLRLQ